MDGPFRMLSRDESIEDKFKTLLNNDPLGATVRIIPSGSRALANCGRSNKTPSLSL